MGKRKMIFHEGYDKLTKEEKKRICNGMGSSNASFDFVPDTFYGLDMGESGNRHDHGYEVGHTRFQKFVADAVFLFNMLAQIEEEGGNLVILRINRATKYCKGVLIFGNSSFFKEEKDNENNQPEFNGFFFWWKKLRYNQRIWKAIQEFVTEYYVTQENYNHILIGLWGRHKLRKIK